MSVRRLFLNYPQIILIHACLWSFCIWFLLVRYFYGWRLRRLHYQDVSASFIICVSSMHGGLVLELAVDNLYFFQQCVWSFNWTVTFSWEFLLISWETGWWTCWFCYFTFCNSYTATVPRCLLQLVALRATLICIIGLTHAYCLEVIWLIGETGTVCLWICLHRVVVWIN